MSRARRGAASSQFGMAHHGGTGQPGCLKSVMRWSWIRICVCEHERARASLDALAAPKDHDERRHIAHCVVAMCFEAELSHCGARRPSRLHRIVQLITCDPKHHGETLLSADTHRAGARHPVSRPQRERGARLATAAISSVGLTGLPMWLVKPASSAFNRSPSRAYAVNAIDGIPPPSAASRARMRRIRL